MAEPGYDEQALIAKIRSLPPDKVVEVEDFVEFLRRRDDDRQLAAAATKVSESAFARVWGNADDDAYDRV